MSEPVISVLLVEDNPGDARLVQELLREPSGSRFRLECVEYMAAALDRLRSAAWDVVLLDLSLPDSGGLDSLTTVRAAAPGVPVVVLTGFADDDLALRAMQAGAQDYLVKGSGDGDVIRRSLRYAVERSRADEALRRSEARFRAIFEDTMIGIALVGPDATLIDANPALHDLLGWAEGELRGVAVAQLIHPADAADAPRALTALLAGDEDSYAVERRFRSRTGATIWVRVHVSLVRDARQQPLFAIGLVEDISARKAMEDRLRLAATVFENTSEGIFVTDAQRRIVHVNPAFTELTGYAADEVIGQDPGLLGSGRHDAAFFERMNAELAGTGKWKGEIWNRRKGGELFAAWLNISAVRNEADEVASYVAVFSDITLRKQTEERLTHQANHDPLTGLPNRTLFHERLERALTRAYRNGLKVALLFLDLDRFKEINDTCGHVVGDQLLQQVAERLTGCTRQGDTVARLSGDEFTVILEDVADFRDAAVVAQKIVQRLAEPFVLGQHRLNVTISIGISLYPADGADTRTLIHHADEAMYRAKRQGRNGYRFHSEALNLRAVERQVLEGALRSALERGEFVLHYQPVYDLASGTAVAAEALLRWRHAEMGLATPAQFMSLAEETGVIVPVDRWVLAEACRQLRQWQRDGMPDLYVCVNVGSAQLAHLDILDSVAAALQASGLDASRLQIDVPEGAVLAAGEGTVQRRVLDGLRGLGVRIALDGFGAGQSSVGMLRRLPIDAVKIDQSFVRDLLVDDGDAKAVTAIVAVAHGLQLGVVAVGVETPEQLAFLKKYQCDLAQGFLFNRPLPPEEFTQVIGRRAAAFV